MKTLNIEPSRVGKRGIIVIPAEFRAEYGMDEGQAVLLEPTPDGVLVKAAVSVPIRRYTTAEKAEFILRAALTREEYQEALAEVEALGVDPKSIPHRPPK